MGKGKTVLITGASSGIGVEFARLFAKDSFNLILVARSEERLKAIGEELSKEFKVSVKVIPQDLAKKDAAQQIFNSLARDKIQIDILVNNAGFANWGSFENIKPEKTADEIAVNISSLTILTRLLLPQIKERQGKILNVASMAAFLPGPFMAVYYASKAYVFSFSQALRNELKDSKVTVTVLCPGPTKTGFEINAHMEKSKLFKIFPMSAEEVAGEGYKGLLEGKPTVIPGFWNKISYFLVRFVPIGLLATITRFVNE